MIVNEELRKFALEMAVRSCPGDPAKRIVEAAEAFYAYLVVNGVAAPSKEGEQIQRGMQQGNFSRGPCIG